MEDNDVVTTTPCPYGGRGEDKHHSAYLILSEQKLQCYQRMRMDNKPCPVKAFKCNKDHIKCNVCDGKIEIGAVLFIHPSFLVKGGQFPKVPNGKYCCSKKCYWGDTLKLMAKFRSKCSKCQGMIPAGSPIKEVY
jgi:hypothetical protein